MNKNKRIWLILVFLLIFHSSAYAGYININKIVKIESSGNWFALNRGAVGVCQITNDCLKDWNTYHKKEQYGFYHLFIPAINKRIASWYLNVRIPKMLKHYKIEVNTKNILICYNSGISTLIKNKKLSKETKDYLLKYEGR